MLAALLEKDADNGIEPIENLKILQLPPFDGVGAPMELVNAFGRRRGDWKALHALEQALYG